MGYEVVSAATEEEREAVTEVDLRIDSLESIAEHVGPETYVVVATHGHYDELALVPALRSGARYVGLVASLKRAASVLEYLRSQGLGERELAALHAPAGLDIQAHRGEEIALSILAEIVQHRAGRDAERFPSKASESAEATDPVCGMSVRLAGSVHTHEHSGETFHFCGAGCRQRFAEDPARYLQARG